MLGSETVANFDAAGNSDLIAVVPASTSQCVAAAVTSIGEAGPLVQRRQNQCLRRPESEVVALKHAGCCDIATMPKAAESPNVMVPVARIGCCLAMPAIVLFVGSQNRKGSWIELPIKGARHLRRGDAAAMLDPEVGRVQKI